MKYRQGFVTNSSSSMFIAHVNIATREWGPTLWKIKELEPILFPEHYVEPYLKWLDEHYPRTKKDNPNGIPSFLEHFEPNPEYEKLPEVPDPWKEEDLYIEEKYGWDIKPIIDPESNHVGRLLKGSDIIVGLDFCTTMDNFDYKMYFEFLRDHLGQTFEITDEEEGHCDRYTRSKTSGLKVEPNTRDLMRDIIKEEEIMRISLKLGEMLEIKDVDKQRGIYNYLEEQLWFWKN